jgi:hypothetical protein
MQRPERSLNVDGTEYQVLFTGVTDTLDGVTHMSVRFTDPQTEDHFHMRFQVPAQTDPAEYFARIPESDLAGGLRSAVERAALKPTP